MKKITVKNSLKFSKLLSSEILEIGGKKIEETEFSIRYELETSVGKLFISVDKDNISCYTMFSRFEDVIRAKEKFTCNPYTGKYNFHIGSHEVLGPDQAVERCIMGIEQTLN
jgi:hypothetical protein